MQINEQLVRKIYLKNTVLKYETKYTYLNGNNKNYVYNFLINKLFISILILFFSFLLLGHSIVISVLVVILFNILYGYIKFDRKLLLRQKQLEKDSLFFFEVLVLSLKSGKNLNQALVLTCDSVDNLLSNEIKDIMKDTKYGTSLHEALINYERHIPSDSIRSIINTITETYISGKDMISSIDKELDLLENKRVYDIKTYINKLPIKISVISVFILIPLMLLLILSPVILDYFS